MTDATLRRLMNSDKGMDVARAVVYLMCNGYDDCDGSMLNPSSGISLKEALEFALKKEVELGNTEGYEVTKAYRLICDIFGNRGFVETLWQQAQYRRETLINVMTSAWLYEVYTDNSAKIGDIDLDTAYESEDPSKCSILQYLSKTEYGIEQVTATAENHITIVESMRTIAAHYCIIDLAQKYYKIPEIEKLKQFTVSYESFCEDFNATRKPLVRIIERKYKGTPLYDDIGMILNKCFSPITPKSFLPDETKIKKAAKELRRKDGRTQNYYNAFNVLTAPVKGGN